MLSSKRASHLRTNYTICQCRNATNEQYVYRAALSSLSHTTTALRAEGWHQPSVGPPSSTIRRFGAASAAILLRKSTSSSLVIFRWSAVYGQTADVACDTAVTFEKWLRNTIETKPYEYHPDQPQHRGRGRRRVKQAGHSNSDGIWRLNCILVSRLHGRLMTMEAVSSSAKPTGKRSRTSILR